MTPTTWSEDAAAKEDEAFEEMSVTADYSIPLAGVHRRSGEQVSGTSAFDVLHREKAAIRFLGSASRDCSLFVRDGSPSSSLAYFVPS
uniref:Uncharacterized protein n=1 Tax=Oryza sativa subsp. japonica TaxID=39947 RepID=Q6AVK4_ORYSJ|nr:hypothetical protein [Oryza sativa Japonica Group]